MAQPAPSASRPSYDTVAQAASGYLKLLVNPANPRVVGPAIADAVTGFYAAYGVLGALYERSRTGHGRKVEVSMLEAMAHWNLDAFTHYYSAGEVMGPFSRPRVSQSYVMECKDGKWVALHMSSPEKFWQGLANAIERPDMFQDPRFADREARIEHQEDDDRGAFRHLRHAHPHRVVQPPPGRGRAARAHVRHRRGAARPAGAAPAAAGAARATPPWASSARSARRFPSMASGRFRCGRRPTLGEHNGEIDAMLREAGRVA